MLLFFSFCESIMRLSRCEDGLLLEFVLSIFFDMFDGSICLSAFIASETFVR
jgi:hypothetical protein